MDLLTAPLTSATSSAASSYVMEPLIANDWLQENNLDSLFDMFEQEMEAKNAGDPYYSSGSSTDLLLGSAPLTSQLFGTSPSLASAIDLTYDLLYFENQNNAAIINNSHVETTTKCGSSCSDNASSNCTSCVSSSNPVSFIRSDACCASIIGADDTTLIKGHKSSTSSRSSCSENDICHSSVFETSSAVPSNSPASSSSSPSSSSSSSSSSSALSSPRDVSAASSTLKGIKSLAYDISSNHNYAATSSSEPTSKSSSPSFLDNKSVVASNTNLNKAATLHKNIQNQQQHMTSDSIANSINYAMKIKKKSKKRQSEGISLLARPKGEIIKTVFNTVTSNITDNHSDKSSFLPKISSSSKSNSQTSSVKLGAKFNQHYYTINRNTNSIISYQNAYHMTGSAVIREHAYAVSIM